MAPSKRGWSDLFDPGRAEDFFARLGDQRRPALAADHGWGAAPWSTPAAWWCSEIARTVYRRDARPEFFAAAGLVEEHAWEAGTHQAAFVRGPGVAFLAFRGTDEPADWMTNLRARPVPWAEGGLVHEGFARALDALWPALEPVLQHAAAPIVAVGHSLGGALATLALSRAPLAAAYSFGAPRVGDDGFVASLRAPLYRFVHGRDPVPNVPPRRWGFRQGGELCALASRSAPPAPGDSRLEAFLRVLSEVDLIAPPAALADHAPLRYSDALLATADAGL